MRKQTWEELVRLDSHWLMVESEDEGMGMISVRAVMDGSKHQAFKLTITKSEVGMFTTRPISHEEKRQEVVDRISVLKKEIHTRDSEIHQLNKELL